jgi:hypothetical protein
MIRRTVAAIVIGLVLATAGVAAIASPPREGFAADPAAHAAEKQWVFDVAFDKGTGGVASARSANAKKPIATARVMGRFALELWVGRELLDRVRFDVPLLGDDSAYRDNKSFFKKPTFQRVSTKVKVQMADSPRATVLAFVDRSTGDTRKYFWPPDEKGVLTPFSAKSALGDASALADAGPPPDASALTADAAPPPADARPPPPPDAAIPLSDTPDPADTAPPAVKGAPTSVPVAPTSTPVAPRRGPLADTSPPVAPTAAPKAGAPAKK